ncbi:MAG: AMP-binding protein [Chloroflexi bacterium]|nr:AMP-binding protein [Chloroflexota bacterium]
MTEPIHSLLETHATRHPEKAALIFKRGAAWDTVTFGQLHEKTELLSRGLVALGLRAGQRVALMSPPAADFFALCFALLKLGLVPVMVDPAIGLRNVTDCLNESQPEIFLGNTLTHAIRKIYGWGKDTVKHNISIASVKRLTFNVQHSNTSDASSHAAIIYTSGSTGLPKGAVYSQQNFSAQLNMLRATFDIHEEEIDLPAFPLFALIDILLGVTSVIPDMRFPPPAKVDPAKVTDAIRRFNVTNMFASPIMLDHVADYALARGLGLPSLKRVITAGAPAPVTVLEQAAKLLPSARIFGIYGATESLPISVIDSKEILKETRHLSAKGAGVCIGKPVDGADVRIIRISDSAIQRWDDSLELPINEVGEITVKGGAVTKAYVARDEANRLAKIDDRGETVHRMGDLGYFDESGRLWYCGRKSHRVETRHGTFFTEQIEGIFNAHPSVYRTALVGVDGEPMLWVELEASARNADKESIKRELIALAKSHPQAAQIKNFLFAKKFPTDVRHNSKIIREKLTSMATLVVE